ncbi:hypothetical protein EYF80_027616 [Liparis tanakae]|uniref:Uncharacterized protein n=1 Tax=Liparis tanakae TaxID=230148 RepID=A0A4Z2H8M5_9TELE|nr:hypothetical protein EYF80_027616 [Liparis tanakae]
MEPLYLEDLVLRFMVPVVMRFDHCQMKATKLDDSASEDTISYDQLPRLSLLPFKQQLDRICEARWACSDIRAICSDQSCQARHSSPSSAPFCCSLPRWATSASFRALMTGSHGEGSSAPVLLTWLRWLSAAYSPLLAPPRTPGLLPSFTMAAELPENAWTDLESRDRQLRSY